MVEQPRGAHHAAGVDSSGVSHRSPGGGRRARGPRSDAALPRDAQIRDSSDALIAAALTCRARIGKADAFGMLAVLDRHSELDLLAVRESARGKGLGSRLVRQLEVHLATNGVRSPAGSRSLPRHCVSTCR